MSEVICKSVKNDEERNYIWKELQRVIKNEEGNYSFQKLNKSYDKIKEDEEEVEFEVIQEEEINGEFIKDLAFDFYNHNFHFDFVDGVDWEGLCEYYGVEMVKWLIEGSIGYDHPEAGKPNPRFGDYKFYGQVVGEDKYLMISKTGEHDLIDPDEAGHGVEFP